MTEYDIHFRADRLGVTKAKLAASLRLNSRVAFTVQKPNGVTIARTVDMPREQLAELEAELGDPGITGVEEIVGP